MLILYHLADVYESYICTSMCVDKYVARCNSLAIKRNALVAFLAQQSSESIPSTLDRRPTGHHGLEC